MLAQTPGVRVVRNGSWGMLWLEPMIEVVVDGTRIAYGPVQATDIPKLLKAGLLTGGDHKLRLGPTMQLPWMQRQQRVTFQRVGLVDPRSAADYEANGGIAGLRRAIGMTPSAVVQEVTDSGLRGRGGAAFPTGIKWKTVLETTDATKYIVCNADEGDSGTFADRMLMEGDPFMLLEGMAIAGFAVGASVGYIYVRSEYPSRLQPHRAGSGKACSAPISPSTFMCALARAPTCAAKKPRCWKALKENVASFVQSHHFPHTLACSANQQ